MNKYCHISKFSNLTCFEISQAEPKYDGVISIKRNLN